MSDHDDSFLLCQLSNGVHQLFLVFRVHVGRGLVQNDDGGVLHHGTGDGDALFFTAREMTAAAACHRVKAVFQPHDEVITAAVTGCLFYLKEL